MRIFLFTSEVSWLFARREQLINYSVFLKGLRADDDRTTPIIVYPAQKNIKALRRFLGIVGGYARFLKRDTEIKVPLTKLLRKGEPFVWGLEQQQSFDPLKRALTSALVLARPDFSRPFSIAAISTEEVEE